MWLGIPFRYPCQTQNLKETKTRKSSPTEINLGWQDVITRWKAGSIIKWAVNPDGFEDEDASYAVDQLIKATKTWNDMELGVSFFHVEDSTSAAFILTPYGDNGTTLADAFLPNAKRSNYLNVYNKAFQGNAREYLDRVFQHELGHILGLRHEFAAEEGDYVLFGAKNPSSVMSYMWPPVITEQDIKETQEFYAWKKPTISSEINSYQVIDQLPRGGK